MSARAYPAFCRSEDVTAPLNRSRNASTFLLRSVACLALRLPPEKIRDKLFGLLYNRGHESKNQYQREALYH